MPLKRLTAKKVRIVDIVSGRYFPGSKEDMRPSYVITPFGQKVSRVNLVASVTEKFLSEDGNYSTITIDDGTEAIRVKAFRERVSLLKDIEPGDLVLVIGKIKEYNGEVYVNGEIVRKVDANYESLRRLEILNQLLERKRILEEMKKFIGKVSDQKLRSYAKSKGIEGADIILEELKVAREMDYKPKILKLIESLDEGNGVEIGKILELSDLPENIIEKAINELLASGEIYEPSPGILKKID